MNIRLNFSHPAHLSLLAGVQHDFYIPPNQRQWNDTAREDYLEFHEHVPDNLHFDEDVDEPDIVVKGDDGDIQMPLNPNAKAKDGCINAYMTESMLVIAPPPNKLWYLLGKGVDHERFSGWKGDLDGDIVTTGNNMYNRGHVYDLDVADRLRSKFGDRFKIYGRNKDEHGGCDAFVKHEELADVLREASVYVNLAHNSVSPNTLIEAMSVAVPIVSVRAMTVNDFITHDYNGIITEKVVEDVVGLLDDYERAEKLSKNVRETVLGKYNLNAFQQRWMNLISVTKMLKERGVI